MLPWLGSSLKFMLNLLHMIYIQGKELYLGNLINYVLHIGLCSGEQISLKLGMMKDMYNFTFWYQFEWPWHSF